MATYTSYLNLEKPTTSETFNLLKMNQNWDKIDAGVSALNSNLAPTACTVNLASVVTSGAASILVIKAGHIVEGIFTNLKVSSAITTDTVVATIQNAAPTNQVFFNGKTLNGTDVLGFIKTDGTINISGITGLAANTNVYGTFMYVTSA